MLYVEDTSHVNRSCLDEATQWTRLNLRQISTLGVEIYRYRYFL